MTIIDTHCHLIDEAFTGRTDEVVKNAIESHVDRMVLACCNAEEFLQINALCAQYPDNLFPTLGIHPENMETDIEAQWIQLKELGEQHLCKGGKLVAVGEIGIDLHWDQSRLSDQLRLLEWQCDWAIEHDLPVLLHIRDAMNEWLSFMQDYPRSRQLRGVLHCYSGTAHQAAQALTYGDWYFGIGGTLTYKKSLVPEVARNIGLSRIVLETDAPYLAPVPFRGKTNQPAYTAITAQALATLLETDLEEVAATTTQNAEKLLRLCCKTSK